ncbi:MAG: hypothetical protein LBR95_02845 [Azoarcus sp.]|jgi:hypothetical protein|nr:hypothetical protein [Azoarcus sp.]
MRFPATFFLPPILRRPLLFCTAALIAAALAWHAAAHARAQQQAAASRAGAAIQALETSLALAHEAEARRMALAQRAAALAAMADKAPEDAEWERLAKRLAGEPRIVGLVLRAQSAPVTASTPNELPSIEIQRLRIDAGLLHEEALLTLHALVADTSARLVPAGCILRREKDAPPAALQARCEFDRMALAPSLETP